MRLLVDNALSPALADLLRQAGTCRFGALKLFATTPITAFAGTDDSEASVAELQAWRMYGRRFCGVPVFPGSHIRPVRQAGAGRWAR